MNDGKKVTWTCADVRRVLVQGTRRLQEQLWRQVQDCGIEHRVRVTAGCPGRVSQCVVEAFDGEREGSYFEFGSRD
jgi:hypothetical protein